jgi:hypothetical protein
MFAYYVGATILRVPVYDLLAWILHYAQYWRTGEWWHYLWLPHNEHRLIWSRLLLVADIEWFRGSTLPFLLFNSASFLLTVGCPLWVVSRASLPTELRAAISAVVILLVAASYAAIYCSVPVMGEYVHTTGLLVLSLALLGKGNRRWGRPAAAIACAVLAAFGFAGGLLAPPTLFLAAWRARLGRGWLIALGLIGLVLMAVYLPGLPVGRDAGALTSRALPAIFDYGTRFLGLPWSHVPSLVWFGRIKGAAVAGLGIATLLWRGLRPGPTNEVEQMGIGLLFFTLAIAALATVARTDNAPGLLMPIRYGIFAALAEVGLLLANVTLLARLWATGGRRPLQWVIVAAACVMLLQQVVSGQAAVAVKAQYVECYHRFAAGEWTGAMNRYVFPNREDAERGLAVIRALNIYQN